VSIIGILLGFAFGGTKTHNDTQSYYDVTLQVAAFFIFARGSKETYSHGTERTWNG
jgi:Tfp pilus assembly protein FimT